MFGLGSERGDVEDGGRRHIELGVKGRAGVVEAAFAALTKGLDALGEPYEPAGDGPDRDRFR